MAAINYQLHKPIWDFLITMIPNPFGAAGLMGNLFAESSLDPKCLTGEGVKTKTEKEEYWRDVKSGVISAYLFARDEVAVGLVQWRYWSRKEALMTYAKEHNLDIDEATCQLNFMIKEIQTYKTVWNTLKNATSVREASDIVMERYEKPGNLTDKAKQKRANFGQECYDLFTTGDIPVSWDKYVVTKMVNVNLRSGNGKEYGAVIQAKKSGEKYKWVATAQNGWHAIVVPGANGAKSRVLWISPEYAELVNNY